jgi:hypothetical protein
MLTDLSQDVANCYQRAAECAERAGACADADMRDFYVEREHAWLKLAHSYQAAERLSRRLDRGLGVQRAQNFREWPATTRVRNCPSCKVETAVTCDGLIICPNCQRIVDQVVTLLDGGPVADA